MYVALNLEHYAFGEGLTEELVPGMPQPDVLNYLLARLRQSGRRLAAGAGVRRAPAAGHRARQLRSLRTLSRSSSRRSGARGDEIAAHGRTNSERQSDLDEAGERALIAEATETIAAHEGTRPAGWLGPWIAESALTPDLLQEAGYAYVLDWCADDQPLWLATRAGRILAVPYPQELNDSTAIIGRRVGRGGVRRHDRRPVRRDARASVGRSRW